MNSFVLFCVCFKDFFFVSAKAPASITRNHDQNNHETALSLGQSKLKNYFVLSFLLHGVSLVLLVILCHGIITFTCKQRENAADERPKS